MVLCILLYATLGLIFDTLIRLLERITMPWRRHSSIR
jgi:sulfonate transport system permease protein